MNGRKHHDRTRHIGKQATHGYVIAFFFSEEKKNSFGKLKKKNITA